MEDEELILDEEYDPCRTLDGDEEYRKECEECGDYGFTIPLNSNRAYVCSKCYTQMSV
jgi:hypothetical protein